MRITSKTSDPPDGGWGWMCVLGKLFSYFCVLGTSSAFGIIYIDLIDYFNATREEVAWVGSLTVGLSKLSGPLSSALITKIGIQKTTALGTFIAFSGCFISWFATGLPYLYVSYGVMLGVGLGLIFVPSMLIVIQYFTARVGLANAIGSIGEGLGTLVLPPLYTYLLGEYGWRGTMPLLSGIVLNGFVCAVIFIPPPHLKSLPKSSPNTGKPCRSVSRLLCNPCLVLYTLGTSLGFFGYIVPYVHLPDMAVQGGMEKYQAALLVSIMGISSIVGRIVLGWISDFPCVNVIFLQGLSLLTCGVVTAVCPHLTEFYALAVYSVLYGTFIGVYGSLLPVAASFLVGPSLAGDALGIILFLIGILSTASSPVAGWLYDTTRSYNASFYLVGCTHTVAGFVEIVVMILHRRQNRMDTHTSDVLRKQNTVNGKICTLEQTYM